MNHNYDENVYDNRRALAIDAVAGAMGGLCADAVLHPVDTVKSKLQAQRGPPWMYHSMTHALQRVATVEGVRRGLYAGFGAVLAGTIPTNAIMFGVYKSVMRAAESSVDEQYVPVVDMAAGAFGEACALITYVPAEVVAKRMQVSYGSGPARNYHSAAHAFRVIHRTEGVAGLYTGLLPTLLRDVPFTAVQFAMFFGIKRYITQSGEKDLTNYQAAGLGCAVGAVAAIATNPCDVVKTRMQVQETGATRKYRGVIHCFRTIVREEGVSALARGVGPRVMWVAPGSAITLAVYEAVSRFLDRVY